MLNTEKRDEVIAVSPVINPKKVISIATYISREQYKIPKIMTNVNQPNTEQSSVLDLALVI